MLSESQLVRLLKHVSESETLNVSAIPEKLAAFFKEHALPEKSQNIIFVLCLLTRQPFSSTFFIKELISQQLDPVILIEFLCFLLKIYCLPSSNLRVDEIFNDIAPTEEQLLSVADSVVEASLLLKKDDDGILPLVGKMGMMVAEIKSQRELLLTGSKQAEALL